MFHFGLNFRGNFQVNMGVVQLDLHREIVDLLIGVETKVKAPRNQDLQACKVRGNFKVKTPQG